MFKTKEKQLSNPMGLIAAFVSNRPFLSISAFFIGGILFWGAFNWSLEVTNTESFCISCHEMRANIYPEYIQSVHYKNSSGVRATCPDCHVPREWKDKVIRKIGATNELFHKIAGSIDTREKFLDNRLELAKYVWAKMEANDSLECRNCHELTNQKIQGENKAHKRAMKENRTCIDCHKGIAHVLPEEFVAAEHERYEREKIPCGECHRNLDYSDQDWDE